MDISDDPKVIAERAREGARTLKRIEEVLRKGQYRWGAFKVTDGETKISWAALSSKAQSVLRSEVERTGESLEQALNRIVLEAGQRKFGGPPE